MISISQASRGARENKSSYLHRCDILSGSSLTFKDEKKVQMKEEKKKSQQETTKSQHRLPDLFSCKCFSVKEDLMLVIKMPKLPN